MTGSKAKRKSWHEKLMDSKNLPLIEPVPEKMVRNKIKLRAMAYKAFSYTTSRYNIFIIEKKEHGKQVLMI